MTYKQAAIMWHGGFAVDRAKWGATHRLAGSRCYVLDELNTVSYVKLPGNHDVAEALAKALDTALSGGALRGTVADLISGGLAGAALGISRLLGGSLPEFGGEFVGGGFLAAASEPVTWGETSLFTRYPKGVSWFGPASEWATFGHLFDFGVRWPYAEAVKREALAGVTVDS